MNTYVITFEINDATRLESFKAYIRNTLSEGFLGPIHNNAWAIKTSKSAKELRDALLPLLASADRMFIIRSGTEAAWTNSYSENNSNWLKTHL